MAFLNKIQMKVPQQVKTLVNQARHAWEMERVNKIVRITNAHAKFVVSDNPGWETLASTVPKVPKMAALTDLACVFFVPTMNTKTQTNK